MRRVMRSFCFVILFVMVVAFSVRREAYAQTFTCDTVPPGNSWCVTARNGGSELGIVTGSNGGVGLLSLEIGSPGGTGVESSSLNGAGVWGIAGGSWAVGEPPVDPR
jgi:hypothetical protein